MEQTNRGIDQTASTTSSVQQQQSPSNSDQKSMHTTTSSSVDESQNTREEGQPPFKKVKLDDYPDISKIDMMNELAVNQALKIYRAHLAASTVNQSRLPDQFIVDHGKLTEASMGFVKKFGTHLKELQEDVGYDPAPIQELDDNGRRIMVDYIAANQTQYAKRKKQQEEKEKALQDEIERLKAMATTNTPVFDTKAKTKHQTNANYRTIESDYLSQFHGHSTPSSKKNVKVQVDNTDYLSMLDQTLSERGVF